MKKVLIGIGIGLAAIVVAFASGYATWYILSQTSGSHGEQATDAASATTRLAELQAALQSKEAWSGYLLSEPIDPYAGAYVYLPDDVSNNEVIGLQADEMLTMTLSSGSAFDAQTLDSLEQTTAESLSSEGYTRVEVSPQLPELLGSFKSNELTCSLLGTSGAQSVALACVSTASVPETSELFTTLEGLQSGSSPNSPVSTLDVVYDESRHGVAILKSVTAEGGQTSARVFAYDGTTWTYIDDGLAGLTGETQGGKIALTPALEALMSDATFGPLYTLLLGMDEE